MKNPVVWFEVVGRDGARLRQYCSDLFGWKIDGAPGEVL
jgi:predicted enzyme related to lactoylglutathione lyase